MDFIVLHQLTPCTRLNFLHKFSTIFKTQALEIRTEFCDVERSS
ncbi:hypothetical protein CIT292_05912 [Citrobacter youngae ATCC 29220]|uniref:Uncharacterized protein n=1 Tax=Citrobacter youngae ATCC 29220 TaxID=500640 RepID=D4B6H6_9ENTR|nr:hypothetical protein CIT292_05912 [Citrobacter youngae ATCC 29220]